MKESIIIKQDKFEQKIGRFGMFFWKGAKSFIVTKQIKSYLISVSYLVYPQKSKEWDQQEHSK